jgi:hypothetical protein
MISTKGIWDSSGWLPARRSLCYHSSNSKVGAHSFVSSVLKYVCQSPYSRGYQVAWLKLPQFLRMNKFLGHGLCTRLTSCQSQSSTDPGSSRPFSQTAAFVRSRHRASKTFPFFSLETFEDYQQIWRSPRAVRAKETTSHTSGCIQRFFLLVRPNARNRVSFSLSSSVSARDIL